MPIVALGSRRLRAVVATVVLMLVCFAAGVAVADAQSPSKGAKAVRQAGVTVAELQAALGVTADGVYGPQTRRAVRRFQRARGLTVDGIAGPQTLEALGLAARESPPRGRVGAILARIAQCESGGDPTAVSANGRYFGKYQFSKPTWRAVGGTGNPPGRPRLEQDERGRDLRPGRRPLARLRPPPPPLRPWAPPPPPPPSLAGERPRVAGRRPPAAASPPALEPDDPPPLSPPPPSPSPTPPPQLPAPRARPPRATQPPRRRPRHDGVVRHVLGDHGVPAHDCVVADRTAAQDAGAVADPAVVADADVALVDPLQPDRPLGLDDPVVEVDEHHPVGDDALAADRDVLEGGDRALLAHHRLRADLDRPRARGPSCRGRSRTSGRA